MLPLVWGTCHLESLPLLRSFECYSDCGYYVGRFWPIRGTLPKLNTKISLLKWCWFISQWNWILAGLGQHLTQDSIYVECGQTGLSHGQFLQERWPDEWLTQGQGFNPRSGQQKWLVCCLWLETLESLISMNTHRLAKRSALIIISNEHFKVKK